MNDHIHGYNGGSVPILTIKLDEIKKRHLALSLRELLIARYREIINRKNDFNAWDKKHQPEQCPDFNKIGNEELLEKFEDIIATSSAPCG